MKTIPGFLLFLAVGFGGIQVSAGKLPNIVFLLADDQGYDETGYNGHLFVKTPVLDEMASKGLRFDQFYAQAPVCSPTRASIITGRHPNRSGVLSWNYSLHPEEISIAQLAKKAGYTTAHFGKWHLGPCRDGSLTNPGAMGFDEWLSHDNFFGMNPIFSRNGQKPKEYPGESSEVVVKEAMRFIDRSLEGDKPFFVFIWFGSPHGPYAASDQDLGIYNEVSGAIKQLARDGTVVSRFAEITAMDRSIGWLRHHLREKNQADDTLFWFTSDNGHPGSVSAFSPLRGAKSKLYQGGIRVPSILEWPAKIKRPLQSNFPAVTTDIFLTLCDVMGAAPPDRPLDGISLRTVWEQGENVRSQPLYFWQALTGEKAFFGKLQRIPLEQNLGNIPTNKVERIQFNNFDFTGTPRQAFRGQAAMIDFPMKLIEPEEGKLELYDLVEDPYETTDLAAQKPGLVIDLTKHLRTWQASVLNSLEGNDY